MVSHDSLYQALILVEKPLDRGCGLFRLLAYLLLDLLDHRTHLISHLVKLCLGKPYGSEVIAQGKLGALGPSGELLVQHDSFFVDLFALDAAAELLVVGLVLVGIPLGKGQTRPVEDVRFAEVGGDCEAVARAGVGMGKHLATGVGDLREVLRGNEVEVQVRLAIPQLADIVVAGLATGVDQSGPSKKTSDEVCMACWPSTTR